MGRTFLAVAHNGFDISDDPILFETRTVLDIESQVVAVKDPWGRVCQTNAYSMAGLVLKDSNIDKGSRWMLADVAGGAIRKWDDLSRAFAMKYDELRRPTKLELTVSSTTTLLEHRVYGEAFPSPEATNLRGKLALLYDEAGEATSLSYDFKGNPLETTRTLRTAYATAPDWTSLTVSADPDDIRDAGALLLESETFTETREYDALNRVTAVVAPDDSRIEPTYNEAGLLEAVNVFVRGAGTATNVVKNIDYDAKGQRLAIEYSADPTTGDARFTTTYTYDPLTFRLANCETLRDPSPQRVQDLSYTYDPSGNIVEIIDDAQQTVFFNNSVVLPANRYEYDPTYRLIRAEGREHASLGIVTVDENDCPLENLPHANMTDAVRNYFEEYLYDRVGNILELFHSAAGTPAATWTRKYEYAPATSGVPNTNRLRSTYSSAPPTLPHYAHDAHGNMTSMPHLATITYNAFDQMASSDAIGGGTAFYVYASGGQRMRKVWEETGSIVHERIYLGGFEIYRRKASGTPTLERETLHVMDGVRRIVMIETKTVDTSGPFTVTPRLRFQLDNHLGSAMLELTEAAERISYEEYHPYGTSAYRSGNGSVEVSARRYRYTGKERDEETGLYYYGARYYACWLGRWTSADPSGIGAGINLYEYCRGSPVTCVDRDGRDWSYAVEQADTPHSRKPNAIEEASELISGRSIDPSFQAKKERREAAIAEMLPGVLEASRQDIERQKKLLPEIARQQQYDPALYASLGDEGGNREALEAEKDRYLVGIVKGYLGFESIAEVEAALSFTFSKEGLLAVALNGDPFSRENQQRVAMDVGTAIGTSVLTAADDSKSNAVRTKATGEAVGTVAMVISTVVGIAGVLKVAKPRPGRLGTAKTRAHVKELADQMEDMGYTIEAGGGRLPEEYLPGPGGGRTGSSWVDITASVEVDGKKYIVRVQTVDTYADGVTPTVREVDNAERIQRQAGGHVILIPKPK